MSPYHETLTEATKLLRLLESGDWNHFDQVEPTREAVREVCREVAREGDYRRSEAALRGFQLNDGLGRVLMEEQIRQKQVPSQQRLFKGEAHNETLVRAFSRGEIPAQEIGEALVTLRNVVAFRVHRSMCFQNPEKWQPTHQDNLLWIGCDVEGQAPWMDEIVDCHWDGADVCQWIGEQAARGREDYSGTVEEKKRAGERFANRRLKYYVLRWMAYFYGMMTRYRKKILSPLKKLQLGSLEGAPSHGFLLVSEQRASSETYEGYPDNFTWGGLNVLDLGQIKVVDPQVFSYLIRDFAERAQDPEKEGVGRGKLERMCEKNGFRMRM